MRISGISGSGLCGGQNKGSETEMVWTCEEEMHRPVTRREKLAIEGTMRGRGRLKKYWGELIRQNMMQFHVIEDMTLDKRVWRTCIRVEG
ncbi:hypothetical protein H5410_022300 [Solanum commersonii]|uniref:Uncharacterized protein n=1 Tax=Solanum commersonii TaxID=4109 RepID=A0A9J5ZDK5_SOLCO|nr:hypothetical protein H5410_022300 [Solanum commersonii]